MRQRVTRRPRRTIGRLCCPIARNAGVRYAPLVLGRSASFPGRPSYVKRGPRPLGRGPEAPKVPSGVSTPILLFQLSPWQRSENKTKSINNNLRRGRKFCEGILDHIEISKNFAADLWILAMDTAARSVSITVARVGEPLQARSTPRLSAPNGSNLSPTVYRTPGAKIAPGGGHRVQDSKGPRIRLARGEQRCRASVAREGGVAGVPGVDVAAPPGVHVPLAAVGEPVDDHDPGRRVE